MPLLLSTPIILIDDYFKQVLNRFKIHNQIINIQGFPKIIQTLQIK